MSFWLVFQSFGHAASGWRIHYAESNMDSVTPAKLAFLTIYNPALGQSDETLDEQILYYYSAKHRQLRKDSGSRSTELENEEKNKRLRQIGLAQGMVEFAKSALYQCSY